MVNLNKVVALPSPRKCLDSTLENKAGAITAACGYQQIRPPAYYNSSLRLNEKYWLHYPVTAIRIYSTHVSSDSTHTNTLHWNSEGSEARLWSNHHLSPQYMTTHDKAQIGPSWPEHRWNIISAQWKLGQLARYLQSSQKTGTKMRRQI